MTQIFCSIAALMCLVHAVPCQNETITAKTSNGLVFSSFRGQMGSGLQRKKIMRIHTFTKGENSLSSKVEKAPNSILLKCVFFFLFKFSLLHSHLFLVIKYSIKWMLNMIMVKTISPWKEKKNTDFNFRSSDAESWSFLNAVRQFNH